MLSRRPIRLPPPAVATIAVQGVGQGVGAGRNGLSLSMLSRRPIRLPPPAVATIAVQGVGQGVGAAPYNTARFEGPNSGLDQAGEGRVDGREGARGADAQVGYK
jgi:hypothetical protein